MRKIIFLAVAGMSVAIHAMDEGKKKKTSAVALQPTLKQLQPGAMAGKPKLVEAIIGYAITHKTVQGPHHSKAVGLCDKDGQVVKVLPYEGVVINNPYSSKFTEYFSESFCSCASEYVEVTDDAKVRSTLPRPLRRQKIECFDISDGNGQYKAKRKTYEVLG